MDVSDIFYFCLLGGGQGGVWGDREGGGSVFLLKIPGGGGDLSKNGGGGRGGREGVCGKFGGRGAKFFFSGRNVLQVIYGHFHPKGSQNTRSLIEFADDSNPPDRVHTKGSYSAKRHVSALLRPRKRGDLRPWSLRFSCDSEANPINR